MWGGGARSVAGVALSLAIVAVRIGWRDVSLTVTVVGLCVGWAIGSASKC